MPTTKSKNRVGYNSREFVSINFSIICKTDLDSALELMAELKSQGWNVHACSCWAADQSNITVNMRRDRYLGSKEFCLPETK